MSGKININLLLNSFKSSVNEQLRLTSGLITSKLLQITRDIKQKNVPDGKVLLESIDIRAIDVMLFYAPHICNALMELLPQSTFYAELDSEIGDIDIYIIYENVNLQSLM